MNAPHTLCAVVDGGSTKLLLGTRQVIGFGLYDLAMRGGIALSDRYGCWTAMAKGQVVPLTRRNMEGGHRVAIDLVQGRARRLDEACRAVLARAERVADQATGNEAHAALAEISDLIASALVGVLA